MSIFARIPRSCTASRLPAPTTGPAAVKASARLVLPQELQLYFSRLTSALIPSVPSTSDPSAASESERHRQAALESLRQDTAVGGILVYIVKWFAESIQKCLLSPTGIIWGLLQGVESLLRNDSVFLEPYVGQPRNRGQLGKLTSSCTNC
jgi:transcription initiation factor TFIID subunit 6